jgi:hypothetical protein
MQIAAKACRQALYSSSQAVARRGGGASAVASPAAANANARTNSLLVFRGRAPIARPQQQQQRQQQRAFSGGATGGPMPTPKYRAPIVVQPSGGASAHSATFIMLHGLGDSGDGWAAIADEFSPELPHVRMIFPHAPLVRAWGASLVVACRLCATRRLTNQPNQPNQPTTNQTAPDHHQYGDDDAGLV